MLRHVSSKSVADQVLGMKNGCADVHDKILNLRNRLAETALNLVQVE
jgi:hypothetical protein